jgi:two-component system, cell cycle sensor histidine kinase and response regulator CckA
MMSRSHQERPPLAGDKEQDALRQIADRVSARIGCEYFQAIVKHLAKALHADSVMIGEFVNGPAKRVKNIAAVTAGRVDYLNCDLPDTAAEQISLGKSIFYKTGACQQLPKDPVLARLRAEGVAGVPLCDREGTPVGMLMAAYRHPVESLAVARTIFKRFTPRASAELVRKQMDERLRESEQRYRAFIMRNPIGMWRIEFHEPVPTTVPGGEQLKLIQQYGYVAECNDAFIAMAGARKPTEGVEYTLDDLWPHSQASATTAAMRLIESGYQFTVAELDLVNPAGEHRHHVRTAWGIVENDHLVRIWGTTSDVTDLRRSQFALEATERRMAHTLEIAQVAVLVIDPAGNIRYANPYLKKVMARDDAGLLGKNWIDTVLPDDERERARAILGGPQTADQSHLESSVIGEAGQRSWIAWDSAVLRDSAGAIESIVLIGRDITEQRAAEEQFRQAQKLEGIGRLAGGIAHDFNNLLTVIVGYCALLEQTSDLPRSAASAVEQVRKAAEKGAQLTNQLLTFSRRQVFRPQVLRLATIVQDAESMLHRLIGDDVNLVTELDSEGGCVRVDPIHIHQVLMNLVVNARDAVPEGGTITIRCQNRRVESSHVAAVPGVPPGEFVVLSVEDTGTGMTEEVRSHLFEPFFTTKERGKGTGMGLPMVYGIVRQSGGYILVDSEPKKGTRIQIFLPRAEQPERSCEDVEGRSELQGGSESILVVDDHQDVRTVAARLLRGLGYTVLEAENPSDALEIVARRPELDLIVTDVMMPGMSGSSLAHLLQTDKPNLRILLMSGRTDVPECPGTAPENGFALLRKPFSPAELAAKVRETLDRKS